METSRRPKPIHPQGGIHDPVRSSPRALLQTLAMSTAAAAKTPIKALGSAAAGAMTPTKSQAPAAAKTPCTSRARSSHASENSNPNIPGTPPPPQSTPSKPSLKSPAGAGARSATAKKKPSTPAPAAPPLERERERRFLVAKKGARRRRNVGTMGGGGGGRGGEIDFDKCREAAREALRASQGEFFRKEVAASTATGEDQLGQEEEGKPLADEDVKGGAFEERQEEETDAELEGSSKVRAMRTKAMAKAMSSVPNPGSGRVKHMVQAFESLLNISGATSDAERAGEGSWALPGLQLWKEDDKGDLGFPPVSVFSSADFQNAGSNRLCSSLDGNTVRSSWDSRTSTGECSRRNSSESLRSRTSAGGRRSRRNSSESLRSSWNKKLKVTSQHPFKLRTEVLDRNKFAEQQRLEWERQQELDEEERIRQLRRTELIPKAQPMPYFDRPFIPKRSTKPPTVPMEPKFYLRPEKLSCMLTMLGYVLMVADSYYRQQCMELGKLNPQHQCQHPLWQSRNAEHRHT
ncbi:TPX2 (targeting protein for Xklp2) protein family [Zea mays]|uniref:TPX2 (Targeting protein for Xklp2) protein family n=1 Tax=Zea mays TaxID=4577 RepID=A0A1D6PHI3_MAIZE|nr:TPX2 (targeting protein for Xklp2) protein family [Zea mays]